MKSRIIPFSALELSLAVLEGNVTRTQAIEELKKSSGFCENMSAEQEVMTSFFIKENSPAVSEQEESFITI